VVEHLRASTSRMTTHGASSLTSTAHLGCKLRSDLRQLQGGMTAGRAMLPLPYAVALTCRLAAAGAS